MTTFRFPPLAGLLLLAAMPLAAAETPYPDPIAPAVIGRPLDQIRPARPVRQKATVAKVNRPKQVAMGNKAALARPMAPVAAAPAAVAQATPTEQHVPKQALDDRVDLQARMADDVGKGTRMGRKPLGPGAYFSSKDQVTVRKYYGAQSASSRAPAWKIGERVPARATMTGVPDSVRAALPRVPPGYQYVQLDGEVVLVAMHSRMVVDGVSRGAP